MLNYRVGTSGFSYPNWHGEQNFYPTDCKNDLSYYASHFNFVEINHTFYRYPSSATFEKWKKIIPQHFLFSIKAHRYFTHMKRFNIDEQFIEHWQNFWNICQILKPQLGPILFQLPPSFKFKSTGSLTTIEKLKKLYSILPKKHPVVFECRDTSWQCNEILKLFQKYNWCFCVIHINNQNEWAGNLKTGFFPNKKAFWQSADWGSYFRLHGNLGQYRGLYDKKTLNHITNYTHVHSLKNVYVAFDNTDDNKPSSAIQNAQQMLNFFLE